MIVRCALAALALVLLGAAHAPRRHAHAHPAPKTISVFINDTALSIDPPPRYVRGTLLVPVRRILEALGLPFERSGSAIVTQVADRTISLRGGVEIKGVLFAPLRYFSRGLGAQALFDPKRMRVRILSSLVGRSSTVSSSGGVNEYQGVVEAVDNDSQPRSITVASGASVKTVPVSDSAAVAVNDVVANTTVAGTIADVHVGDYAKVYVRKDGHADRIVDAFASQHGTIAAMAANTIVLGDGHVIVPTGVTALSLNGDGATLADLAVGDDLTVRYNLITSEVRELIATRRGTGSGSAAGAVAITSIEPSATRPLRAGESFDVVMHGTPGGQARFDVGPYFSGLPMTETSAGVYTARYTIPRGANFSAAPVFGHLTVRGVQAPRAISAAEISASSTPPGIVDFAPDNGQTVNNDEPSIYATFSAGAVPVNPSSIVLIIDGHDVTASATRTQHFIEYHPLLNYPDGTVHVTVRVSDVAGNTASKSWTFQIHTR